MFAIRPYGTGALGETDKPVSRGRSSRHVGDRRAVEMRKRTRFRLSRGQLAKCIPMLGIKVIQRGLAGQVSGAL